MTQPFIGIDFGTCNSSAAWFNPRTGQAESLLNGEGEDKTPSIVYFGPKNEIVVGRYAEERLEDPEEQKRVLSAVKRSLAKKIARVVDGRSITTLEAAALILGKIRWDAEQRHFQEPVTRAVITCPAVFDEVEKDQLREAATRAGFLDVALLEEPVAAADAYTKNGIKVGRHVLVYDLGGGTFDLALLAREEGEDEFRLAMEPRGKRIGGEDFDRVIYDYFEALILEQVDQPICPDGLDLDLLRRCRRVKESLSASEQPPPVTWRGHGKKLTLPLNRARFEALVEKYVELTVRLTRSIQEDAAAAGYPLESVILIGGASRTPCIIRRLQETLQVEPRKWQKQDVAVALGAAYHAQRLWGEKPSPLPPATCPRGAVPQIKGDSGEDDIIEIAFGKPDGEEDSLLRDSAEYELAPLEPAPGRGAADRQQKRQEEERKREPREKDEAAQKQKLQQEQKDRRQQEEATGGAAHEAGERTPCPMCGEMIRATAVKCRFCGEIVGEAPHRTRDKTRAGGPPLASRWSRVRAWGIDLLAAFLVLLPGGIFCLVNPEVGAILMVGGLLILAGRQIYLLSTQGQSIGKKRVGVRIIKQDGGSPGFVGAVLLRSFVPSLIGGIPYLGQAFALVDLLFIFGGKQRCLHDRIAGTIVVEDAARKPRFPAEEGEREHGEIDEAGRMPTWGPAPGDRLTDSQAPAADPISCFKAKTIVKDDGGGNDSDFWEHSTRQFNTAVSKINKGNLNGGFKIINKLLETSPDFTKPWEFCGDWYHRQKEYSEALFHYEEAIKIGTTNPQTYVRAGISASHIGDVERAYTILKQSVSQLPHCDLPGLLWFNLACYATRLQNNDEAMCYLKNASLNGFTDASKYINDPDLIPLRQREDFSLLLRLLDAPSETPLE